MMNSDIFLNRDFIENEDLNDEDLLLIILLTSEFEFNQLDRNLVNLTYLTKRVAINDNYKLVQKKLKKSFNKLIELDIIKGCAEIERGYYMIDTSAFYFNKERGGYVWLYLSDIIKISGRLDGCNLFKMIRLYTSIMSKMDFSSDLPKDYKNKVYHFGTRYLLYIADLQKKSYEKYIKVLCDNKILYKTSGKKKKSKFMFSFISRYQDKDICELFASLGGDKIGDSLKIYQNNKDLLN